MASRIRMDNRARRGISLTAHQNSVATTTREQRTFSGLSCSSRPPKNLLSRADWTGQWRVCHWLLLFCGGLAFAPVERKAARKFGPTGGVSQKVGNGTSADITAQTHGSQ